MTRLSCICRWDGRPAVEPKDVALAALRTSTAGFGSSKGGYASASPVPPAAAHHPRHGASGGGLRGRDSGAAVDADDQDMEGRVLDDTLRDQDRRLKVGCSFASFLESRYGVARD